MMAFQHLNSEFLCPPVWVSSDVNDLQNTSALWGSLYSKEPFWRILRILLYGNKSPLNLSALYIWSTVYWVFLKQAFS